MATSADRTADSYERYAIYWAPEATSPLWRFACDWLGTEPDSGRTVASRALCGLEAATLDRVVAEPARYGVHATLKAPFRLAAGRSRAELVGRLQAFAGRRRASGSFA